jgi:hypothetical protein
MDDWGERTRLACRFGRRARNRMGQISWLKGFRRDAENGNRDIALPSKDPMGGRAPAPAKGSLGWTNGAMAYAQHHGAPTRLLDWSRNPFVGLWFAVNDKNYDKYDGLVYQLCLNKNPQNVSLMFEPPLKFKAGKDFKGQNPVRIFSSPPKIERAEKQANVFSLCNFDKDFAVKPLEEILLANKENSLLRSFSVPIKLKSELRKVLSVLGLDAYSILGGPDALGKAMSTRLRIS